MKKHEKGMTFDWLYRRAPAPLTCGAHPGVIFAGGSCAACKLDATLRTLQNEERMSASLREEILTLEVSLREFEARELTEAEADEAAREESERAFREMAVPAIGE